MIFSAFPRKRITKNYGSGCLRVPLATKLRKVAYFAMNTLPSPISSLRHKKDFEC